MPGEELTVDGQGGQDERKEDMTAVLILFFHPDNPVHPVKFP
jgi:hypothetical protein